jgi:glutaryl-CoA dehydrogenase
MVDDITAQELGEALGTDFLEVEHELGEAEMDYLRRTRRFVRDEVLPVIGGYWERAEFPFDLARRVGELGLLGAGIEGYGCPPMSLTSAGLIMMELSRGDGSLGTFLGVQADLAMRSISMYGSEEQKQQWLPRLAKAEAFGAFALTEPNHGSDSVRLETSAVADGGDFVINGRKRWIGNGSIADVAVVWARGEDGQVGGYLVEPASAPGYRPTVIEGKGSLRAVWQAEIELDDVRVPASAKLPGAKRFKDTGRVLAGMLAEIVGMQLYCLRVAQLSDRGDMTDQIASLAKLNNGRKARQVLLEARDMLGGNGFLLENHVMRHMADLEGIFTYEGTDTIQALLVGRHITGISAFV